MHKVTIIGVPEHFNFPWQLAIDEGAFEERGIDLQWKDIPEGTGRMSSMLQADETDLAIILTEGIVKSISDGTSAKIVQEYIASPLLWGIHVGEKSRFKTLTELADAKVAISRFGSGSHLMAYVHAQQQQWNFQELQFEVVNDIEGAVEALTEGRADYFMWEHFTTKPLVDRHLFRRLGDCPTPWPCFVIAATNRFLDQNKDTLRHILEVINRYTTEFKIIPSIDRTMANRYDLALEDIQKWLGSTRWSQKQISSKVIDNVQSKLLDLKLIPHRIAADKILEKL
ncbi:substrate-binding domain-containing protein [Arenibacter sp. GZD96]|uniref:substrate-binding domain-containing protein n=1 Tax=Aurantibrevibacter litoralis TaxID=3106030 RepID=UPI002AFFB456|nr:substrate-binding domain-containing protein [Arenibacter sp. GZD-96]MEA1785406.1 substrate-binding domain-containing protein [Arenibacter sp. GZD-96]